MKSKKTTSGVSTIIDLTNDGICDEGKVDIISIVDDADKNDRNAVIDLTTAKSSLASESSPIPRSKSKAIRKRKRLRKELGVSTVKNIAAGKTLVNDIDQNDIVQSESQGEKLERIESFAINNANANEQNNLTILENWKIVGTSSAPSSKLSMPSTVNANSTVPTPKFHIEGNLRNHSDSVINGTQITIREINLLSESHEFNTTTYMSSSDSNFDWYSLKQGDVIVESRNRARYRLGEGRRSTPMKSAMSSSTNDTDESGNVCPFSSNVSTYGTNGEKSSPSTNTEDILHSRPGSIRNYAPKKESRKRKLYPLATLAKSTPKSSSSSPSHESSKTFPNSSSQKTSKVTPISRVLEVFPYMHMEIIEQCLLQHGIDENDLYSPIVRSSTSHTYGTYSAMTSPPEIAVQRALEDLANQGCPEVDTNSDSNVTTSAFADALSSPSSTYHKLIPLSLLLPQTSPSTTFYFDYASSSSNYERSTLYKREACDHLKYMFPFLSNGEATIFLTKFEIRYYLTFMQIIDKLKSGCKNAICNGALDSMAPCISASTAIEESTTPTSSKNWSQDEIEEYQYLNISGLYQGQALLPEQVTALEELILSDQSKPNRTLFTNQRLEQMNRGPYPTVFDSILINEIEYTLMKLKEWISDVEDKAKRKELRKLAEVEGLAIECQCCYSDCYFEEMIHCVGEGHLFCLDCVRRHAEEQVFGCGALGTTINNGTTSGSKSFPNNGELGCISVDGCKSFFTRSTLLKALPKKVMERYDELRFVQVLNDAKLKDLW